MPVLNIVHSLFIVPHPLARPDMRFILPISFGLMFFVFVFLQCFCGVEGDDFAELGESFDCTFRCSGDERQTCGGPYAISVYKPAPAPI